MQIETFATDGSAYFLEQAIRPQTIGCSLLDSPVGLAAWMLDHDTDSYYKISRAFVDGEPAGNLTRDNIPRQHHAVLADRHRRLGRPVVLGDRTVRGRGPGVRPGSPPVSVPVAFTTFPGEVLVAPRSWVEMVYPGLAYFNEVDRGGHFAAWEEPELFSTEMRAAFSSLR